MKIVIVGGVAGGMSAATRLRRLMEDAEIVVLKKDRMFLLQIAACLIIFREKSVNGKIFLSKRQNHYPLVLFRCASKS